MAQEVVVTIENPDTAVVAELLAEYQAEQASGEQPTTITCQATLVAWQAAQAVGCGFLAATTDPLSGEINRLYVRPQARGQHIGRQLVGRLEMCAQALGYRQLRLGSPPHHPAARALFSAFGYRPLGTEPSAQPGAQGAIFTKPLTIIRPESPLHPHLAPLFAAKQALSRSLYPAESDYSFSPAELAEPGILFLVADAGDRFLGCGAAVPYADYGEIKSMFVDAEARGQRLGERLIIELEEYLRECGKQVARLETGVASHSAIRLYTRMGYERRGPYGDYADDPLCVFMEKAL